MSTCAIWANPHNCHLALTKVQNMGYSIVWESLSKPQESKEKAICQYLHPPTKTQVHAFLGTGRILQNICA